MNLYSLGMRSSIKQFWVAARRCAVASTLAMLAFSGNLRAEFVELDTIVAIVEADVVLASELLERVEAIKEQFALNNAQVPPDDILVSQIMERLIVESLQLQEAERRGVVIDDETLTLAVADFAAQNNLTLEQFTQALARDGVSYAEFREQIRKEIVMQRLQRNLVNQRISITEQDIEDLLSSPYYQEVLADEFRVGHILLLLENGADEEVAAMAESAAVSIVADLRAGADFAEVAIAKSAGSRALEGGDLGWRRAAELPTLFAEEVIQLAVGETAEPIRSGSGIHIVQLLEQRGAGVQEEKQSLLRHILIQSSEIRSPQQTEALIREIHAKIVAGEDFAELAIEYSDDATNALTGGDLGWTSGTDFVPDFQAVMAATDVGEVSEPFQSQYGWHVLEVQDRRIQDMSDEARSNMAMQILHTRRFEEEVEKWVKELRDEAFVEIRL